MPMAAKTLLLAAAAAALAVQPAVAADLETAAAVGERRGSFAGATLRVPLDGGASRAARPRLAIGFSRVYERVDSTGRIERSVTPGLELGLDSGRPMLLVAGRNPATARQRLGIGGTTTTLLVVAGLAVAAFAIAELTDDEGEDGPCPIQGPC